MLSHLIEQLDQVGLCLTTEQLILTLQLHSGISARAAKLLLEERRSQPLPSPWVAAEAFPTGWFPPSRPKKAKTLRPRQLDSAQPQPQLRR